MSRPSEMYPVDSQKGPEWSSGANLSVSAVLCGSESPPSSLVTPLCPIHSFLCPSIEYAAGKAWSWSTVVCLRSSMVQGAYMNWPWRTLLPPFSMLAISPSCFVWPYLSALLHNPGSGHSSPWPAPPCALASPLALFICHPI